MRRRPTASLRVLAVLLLVLPVVPSTATAQLPMGPAGGVLQDPTLAQVPEGRVVWPSDALTVPDDTQVTGLRMDVPPPGDCDADRSACDDVALLNELDGFDLLPRIVVQLDADLHGDPEEVFTPDVLGVRQVGGSATIGLSRFVYDPATRILYGEPAEQLAESTAHEVVYDGEATRFTTMTASAGLVQMRRQLDSGAAYDAAGIGPAERGLSFTQSPADAQDTEGTELRTAFPAAEVLAITRYDERVPGGELVAEQVIDSAMLAGGTVAFGHYASPSWLDDARTIDAGPTAGDGPAVTGTAQVGVTLILPAGTPPDGGWPLAIFGPGITRSKYDLFLAADLNAAQGLATMSFDPVGHAYGAASEVGVQLATSPEEIRFSGFGRGVDLNDDGVITNQEGVQAMPSPHPRASVGLRDGLRQTAADLMALVRAVRADADVDGGGVRDLSAQQISVYAQSLGGIYSTMMMGADPSVEVAVLNVPGGAILDIARVSPVFRAVVADSLRDRVPGLLNGGVDGFSEDLPLFGVDAAITDPAEGSLAIQRLLYDVNWLNRSGSPEALAPLIQQRPLADSQPKRVLYQFALGDQTVPNPASFRLARAFGDAGHLALYRNDLTATAMTNPHGFLLDPTVQGRNQAQQQVVEFITSGGETILDPDGPLPTWEVPVDDLDILQATNFDEALYAQPTAAPARQVERVEGGDDVGTAAAISAQVHEQAATVVLARVDDYADGLAGGPLAVHLGGPLLLSESTGLPAATAEEVQRLGAESAILLGGEAALAPQVAEDLESFGVEVERIGGANRFATAALIAERLGYSSEVLLVEGEHADPARGWPDALSAAGIGAGLRQPILLTNATRLPQETIDALQPTQDVTVIGGIAAVSEAVAAEVDDLVDDLHRIGGSQRYETAALAADEAVRRGLAPTDVWLSTGSSFATGLAAGAAAGAQGGLFALVAPDAPEASSDVLGWLRQRGASIDTARVTGGAGTLSTATEEEIRVAVGG